MRTSESDGPERERTGDVRLLAAVLAVAWVAAAVVFALRSPAGPPIRFVIHRVDVNRAPVAELRCLPGVGPVLAARIAEERARAPFAQASDLMRVHGIGPGLARRIGPLTVFRARGEAPMKPP